MAKAKTGIVKVSFKACLEGDVYPRLFSAGETLTGEALKIGQSLKKMGGKAAANVEADKNAGRAPENKAGFTAKTKATEAADPDGGAEAEGEADADDAPAAGEAETG